jgi:parallel beta-helix repeat protein
MRRRWNGVIAGGLGLGLLAIGQLAVAGSLYYVDSTDGDNAYSTLQAQDPATPWRTINRTLQAATAGDTVVVQPGEYYESVKSQRDGLSDAPITLQAAEPGAAHIQPPSGGVGIYIQHHYHVIEGFAVSGGTTGIKLGPHRVATWVQGLVARHNEVYDNSADGLQFRSASGGRAEFNTAHGNGLSGLKYMGNGGVIHANTAYGNGEFGIYVRDSVDHQVWDNTAYDNAIGNIKILGATLPPP